MASLESPSEARGYSPPNAAEDEVGGEVRHSAGGDVFAKAKMEGFLMKGRHATNKRYFILSGTALVYKDKPGKPTKKTLSIRSAKVKFVEGSNTIVLTGRIDPSDPSKEYYLKADNRKEFLMWMEAFTTAVTQATPSRAAIEYSRSFRSLLQELRGQLRGVVADTIMKADEDTTSIALANVTLARNLEFVRTAVLREVPTTTTLDSVFATYDHDKDGYITLEEHALVVRQIMIEVGQVVPQLFRDTVLTTMKAVGVRNAEDETKRALARCDTIMKSLMGTFVEEALKQVADVHTDMWASMEHELPDKVSRAQFVKAYSQKPLLSKACVMSAAIDEVALQIQSMITAKSPPVPGICGLKNLGNSCYVNSVLQCLNHAGRFRRFMLMDAEAGANKKLTAALRTTMGTLYSSASTATAVSPTDFRSAVYKTLPAFADHAQHDAHEFLCAVLGQLHDEVNTAKQQPFKELPDSPTMPDHDLAEAWWGSYVASNKSPVVDLFQGQMKSSVLCKVCGTPSLCFDPFMYLLLPIPGAEDGPSLAPSPAEGSRSPVSGTPPSSLPSGAPLPRENTSDPALTSTPPPPPNGKATLPRSSSPPVARPPVSPASSRIGPEPLPRSVSPSTEHAPVRSVTLGECMDAFTSTEWLGADNLITCGKCKKPQQASRQIQLWRPPHYLVICVKRFRHNNAGAVVAKSMDEVSVPMNFDIREWMTSESTGLKSKHLRVLSDISFGSQSLLDGSQNSASHTANSVPTSNPSEVSPEGQYSLFGVIHHRGATMASGHYTSTVCVDSGSWYSFNDSVVTPVVDIVKESDTQDFKRTAYILFYRLR